MNEISDAELEQFERFLKRLILYLTHTGKVEHNDTVMLLQQFPNQEVAMRFKTGYQKDMDKAKEKGLELGQVKMIHGLLANNVKWPIIQRAIGITQAEWPALQERVKALQSS